EKEWVVFVLHLLAEQQVRQFSKVSLRQGLHLIQPVRHELLLGDEYTIRDIKFKGMTVARLSKMLQGIGYKNGKVIDMFLEHHGYDLSHWIQTDIENNDDEISDVEMEDITGYAASDFIGEDDVVIPNSQPCGKELEIDSDDVANEYQLWYRRNDYRSLFVLCGKDIAEGRSSGIKGKKGDWPYKKGKDKDELPKKDKGKLSISPKKEIDSDDEDVGKQFKLVDKVIYLEFDPKLPWNEMKPTLGLRFEHLEQLKYCLTNYDVANEYQLWYRRNDYRSLFVLCGKDIAEGRSSGIKGKKGDWPYKKGKDKDELPKKDKGKLSISPKKGKKGAYIISPSKKGV
nr:S-adenosyl-L-methionine-dependent methyltransferase [Tanacetum cinerariifolium]